MVVNSDIYERTYGNPKNLLNMYFKSEYFVSTNFLCAFIVCTNFILHNCWFFEGTILPWFLFPAVLEDSNQMLSSGYLHQFSWEYMNNSFTSLLFFLNPLSDRSWCVNCHNSSFLINRALHISKIVKTFGKNSESFVNNSMLSRFKFLFHIQKAEVSNCRCHWFQIFDWKNDKWEQIGKNICGRTPPAVDIKTTNNQFRVLFRTNSMITSDGFQVGGFSWILNINIFSIHFSLFKTLISVII